MAIKTATESNVDFVTSFENKIVQLGIKDTAEAVAGAALALAVMELAKQQTIANLIAYHSCADFGFAAVLHERISEALNVQNPVKIG
jgi:hypothetical protein